MGMLEDDLTEYNRMRGRDAKIAKLEAALVTFADAANDVQEHWSDPGSYTHNRLLTPQLVHEQTVAEARAALDARLRALEAKNG